MQRFRVLASAIVFTAALTSVRSDATVTYLTIPTPLIAAINAKYPDNCVKFLRYDMKIRLPSKDLTYWSAKKSIKNISGTPRYGDVAIIEIPSGQWSEYGHLAMVYDVTSTSITILEAHYRGNTVTMRRATGTSLSNAASQLRIYGYFRT